MVRAVRNQQNQKNPALEPLPTRPPRSNTPVVSKVDKMQELLFSWTAKSRLFWFILQETSCINGLLSLNRKRRPCLRGADRRIAASGRTRTGFYTLSSASKLPGRRRGCSPVGTVQLDTIRGRLTDPQPSFRTLGGSALCPGRCLFTPSWAWTAGADLCLSWTAALTKSSPTA